MTAHKAWSFQSPLARLKHCQNLLVFLSAPLPLASLPARPPMKAQNTSCQGPRPAATASGPHRGPRPGGPARVYKEARSRGPGPRGDTQFYSGSQSPEGEELAVRPPESRRGPTGGPQVAPPRPRPRPATRRPGLRRPAARVPPSGPRRGGRAAVCSLREGSQTRCGCGRRHLKAGRRAGRGRRAGPWAQPLSPPQPERPDQVRSPPAGLCPRAAGPRPWLLLAGGLRRVPGPGMGLLNRSSVGVTDGGGWEATGRCGFVFRDRGGPGPGTEEAACGRRDGGGGDAEPPRAGPGSLLPHAASASLSSPGPAPGRQGASLALHL